MLATFSFSNPKGTKVTTSTLVRHSYVCVRIESCYNCMKMNHFSDPQLYCLHILLSPVIVLERFLEWLLASRSRLAGYLITQCKGTYVIQTAFFPSRGFHSPFKNPIALDPSHRIRFVSGLLEPPPPVSIYITFVPCIPSG